MRENKGFFSFAFDSAHVKYGVWTWPKWPIIKLKTVKGCDRETKPKINTLVFYFEMLVLNQIDFVQVQKLKAKFWGFLQTKDLKRPRSWLWNALGSLTSYYRNAKDNGD